MADKPSYVKAAFQRQENLIALAGLCTAGALFNPGFLLLAGAAELAYLWGLSTNARFQRVVDSESNRRTSLFDAKEKDRMLLRLPGEDRDRYLELAQVRQKVYESWQSRDSVSQGLLQPSVDKLDYLLDTFLRAQMTLSLMREHLLESNRGQLDRQLKSTEQELKHDLPENLKAAKAKSMDILKQRVARLDKLDTDMEVLKTQIDNIEHTIKLVSDQTISLSDPQQVATQIDGAVAEVGVTERSLNEVESFLGAQASQKQEAAHEAAQQQGQA